MGRDLIEGKKRRIGTAGEPILELFCCKEEHRNMAGPGRSSGINDFFKMREIMFIY